MSTKRSSFEKGHKRKYLVVIDDTEECDRAVFWASKRAGRTKSQIIMLRVIETAERNQQWLGVADIMKAEATEAANAVLDKFAARVKKIAFLLDQVECVHVSGYCNRYASTLDHLSASSSPAAR